MRVLFATAELRPLVSAGGLGEAAAGLADGLRELGIDVLTAIPDYADYPLTDEEIVPLDVPEWASPASARIAGPTRKIDARQTKSTVRPPSCDR